MAGMVGKDGQLFMDICKENGIDSSFIRQVPGKSGHAIIQLDQNGQNSILLYGGSNRQMTKEYVDEVLNNFEKGDLLLLQNEINLLSCGISGYILRPNHIYYLNVVKLLFNFTFQKKRAGGDVQAGDQNSCSRGFLLCLMHVNTKVDRQVGNFIFI